MKLFSTVESEMLFIQNNPSFVVKTERKTRKKKFQAWPRKSLELNASCLCDF